MDLLTGLLGIALVVALLLLGREVVCWWLKINLRLDEQKRTNALLVALLEAQGADADAVVRAVADPYEALETPVTDRPLGPDSAAYRVGRLVGKVSKKS